MNEMFILNRRDPRANILESPNKWCTLTF